MSHKHLKKIEKVFEHPTSSNIDTKKLIAALEHYGVSLELTKKHKAKLLYKESVFVLALPHGEPTLSKDEVVRLRDWLEEVGLTPDALK